MIDINNKIRFRKKLLNLAHEINNLELVIENLLKFRKSNGDLYNANIFNELSKLRYENSLLIKKINDDSSQNDKIIKAIEQDLEIIERIIKD